MLVLSTDKLSKYMTLARKMSLNKVRSCPTLVEADDLFSGCMLGLMNAVRTFREDRGNEEAYVHACMRGGMLDAMRGYDMLTRHGRRKVNTGEDPLRYYTDVVEDRVVQQNGAIRTIVNSYQEAPPMEAFIDTRRLAESCPVVAKEYDRSYGDCSPEQAARIEKALATCSERNRQVAILRLRGEKQSAIGRYFGITESRVCQILGVLGV